MERAGIAGDLLPWRDVLHEGPVPDLPPDELRRVRAEFLQTLGPDFAAAEVEADLRDRAEHVELICIGSFPGRPGFAGLGELEPDELASLWPLRTAVTPEHVHLAR